MIRIWENLENDESEWRVEGGLRRGGRRVSRRISELLGKFEGEESLKSGGGRGDSEIGENPGPSCDVLTKNLRTRDSQLSTSENVMGGPKLKVETNFCENLENLGNGSLVRVRDVAKSESKAN